MTLNDVPDTICDFKKNFGFDVTWTVPAFRENCEHVPDVDTKFIFSPDATKAISLGFALNRRVYIHGPHGSGKTSHIEQVAARLKWPCLRLNLDGHISRSDLIGRDMVLIKDGLQVTEFVPGILIWALERPIALVLDEYDVGRPDIMFVIQRVLEANGKLTLTDQNRVITPHPAFRLFATGNTAGQGDATAMYVGTQILNQAQLDRWSVVFELGYLSKDQERDVLLSKLPNLDPNIVASMVDFAGLTRQANLNGDLSVLISLRTLIHWAENYECFSDISLAAKFTFITRCNELERRLLAELFQRCFAKEL